MKARGILADNVFSRCEGAVSTGNGVREQMGTICLSENVLWESRARSHYLPFPLPDLAMAYTNHAYVHAISLNKFIYTNLKCHRFLKCNI